MVERQNGDMIQTIVTTDSKSLTIELPDDFLGKKVEIIAFVLDDEQPLTQKRTFNSIEIDTKGFIFNRK